MHMGGVINMLTVITYDYDIYSKISHIYIVEDDTCRPTFGPTIELHFPGFSVDIDSVFHRRRFRPGRLCDLILISSKLQNLRYT
jgi:hypothetical protein